MYLVLIRFDFEYISQNAHMFRMYVSVCVYVCALEIFSSLRNMPIDMCCVRRQVKIANHIHK